MHKQRSKGNPFSHCVLAAAVAAALYGAGSVASAAPTGGTVVGGQAQIGAPVNGAMTIEQSSQRAAINWLGFSIAAGESVRFNQPSASAIALNRVLGQDPSQILGSLSANGQVFILNPNGVLFGRGAQVNVGGIVASTLDLSPQDFMNGSLTLAKAATAGSVVNQGTITAAEGGYVALLGPQVRNEGVITATLGTVALAAGEQVTLNLNGTSLLGLAVDRGAVEALAENRQLIRADGGQVLMTAKAADALVRAVVNNEGVIEARTLQNRNGVIRLMGDMDNGTVHVGGTLDAGAPGGGDGGFIETSAAQVKVAGDARITTQAPHGRPGAWLIDPYDFTIAVSGGDITGAALSTALGSGSVTIQTAAGSASCTGAACGGGNSSGNGDIFVNDTVSWSANTLTLSAYRNIEINSALNGSGTASLALEYGQGAAAAGNTAAYSVRAPVGLPAGNHFSTRLGSNGATVNYTVLTSLGAQGSLTGTDLQGMSGNLAGNYALGADIDASATVGWQSGAGFSPVGSGGIFTGIFDGLGHVVSALTINGIQDFVGLFGRTGGVAVIRNVGMVGGSITGKDAVGGLVGGNLGTISNAYATGAVTGNNEVGGLVGSNGGSISKAYATGAVKGSTGVGGLVGSNGSGGTISNVYATGTVTGLLSVAGLAGFNSGSVSSAYATGAVTGNTQVSGLVGTPGSVSNSYWATDTTGRATSAAGTGLTAAQLQTALPAGFSSSVWGNGDNQTTPYLLGLAGNRVFNANDPSNALYTAILNVNQLQAMQSGLAGKYVLGNDINASATAGWNGGLGFAPVGNDSNKFTGIFDGLGHVVSALAINRPSQVYVGLFGFADGATMTIRNVGMAGGSISGDDYVGGLVGVSGGSVSSAYATGAVTGNTRAGGLAGANFGNISNAYATGAVTGNIDYAGGLVGANFGNISNAYATGTVTGHNNVGGLVGLNGLSVSSAYATGAVTGNILVGGLIGNNSGSVSTSYWDTDTTGRATSAGGTGKTTAQMRQAATFAGWDIDAAGGTGKVWRIYEDLTYPLLRSFLTPLTVAANDATVTYDGTTRTSGAGYAASGAYDPALLLGMGSVAGGGRNAGSYALSLSGLYSTQRGYDLALTGGTLTIDKAPLTVTTADVAKTYDGTTTAAGSALVTGGTQLFGADTLSGGVFAFTDPNAGTGKTVTVANVTVNDGNNGGNYNVSYADNTASTIDRRPVTVTASAGQTKVYGNADPASYTFANSSLGAGVALAGALDRAAGENVGGYAIGQGTLTGANNPNYSLTYAGDSFGITQRPVTVTANAGQTKVYGNADPALIYSITTGNLVGADTLAGALERAAGENVGNYAINQGTLGNPNYAITYAGDNFGITQRPVTVTASAGQTKVYGNADPASYTFANSSLGAGVALAGALDRAAGENVGGYAIGQGTLTGANNPNYSLTYVGDNFGITLRPLSIAADNLGRGVGERNPPFTATFAGFAFADGPGSLAGTLSFATPALATSPPGSYAITLGGLSSSNYAISFVPGELAVGVPARDELSGIRASIYKVGQAALKELEARGQMVSIEGSGIRLPDGIAQ